MKKIKLGVSPDAKYLDLIYEMLDYFFKIENINKRDRFEIKLAVSEAVVNAIEYAEDMVKFELQYYSDKQKIKMMIYDDGKKFHPRSENYSLPEAYSENSRGIYLMNKYMDTIEYEKCEKGTELNMIKKLGG